jgi:hypothetical protein
MMQLDGECGLLWAQAWMTVCDANQKRLQMQLPPQDPAEATPCVVLLDSQNRQSNNASASEVVAGLEDQSLAATFKCFVLEGFLKGRDEYPLTFNAFCPCKLSLECVAKYSPYKVKV